MIKRSILGAVCAGLCAAGAYSSEANAQASERWTGLYGGGHVGGAWADSVDATRTPANAATQAFGAAALAAGAEPSAYSVDPEGYLAGLAMGYNWAFGSFLIGFEGDWSVTSVDDSQNIFTNVPAFGPVQSYFSTDVHWVATLRGRLGVLAGPNLLLYATGGFAFAHVEQESFTIFATNNDDGGQNSDVLTGYAVGGGGEWALSSNWSVKAEYLYISLDSDDFTTAGTSGGCLVNNRCEYRISSDDIELHTVRLGVNYKFGHPEPAYEPMK